MPITTPEQLALAKRVHNLIAAHPEQHNQDFYFLEPGEEENELDCRTQACIAGWTAILNGAYFTAGPDVETPEGVHNIEVYARESLGISVTEAEFLFAARRYGNPYAEARSRRYLEQLIAEAEARLSGASA
jgi:hypothetical protein